MIKENRFSDQEELTRALTNKVSEILSSKLASTEQATLLLSGGKTPTRLYQNLANTKLEWNKVNLALVDERWVAPSSPASNEKMIRSTLLTNYASSAKFKGMFNAAINPDSGAAQCNRHYALLPQPYTLCLLGMGPDGHTASFFPGAVGLDKALSGQSICVPVEAIPSEVTGSHTKRMTMSLWSLLKSETIVLLFTGESKWKVYEQAKTVTDKKSLPVSYLLQQSERDIEVYWCP